MSTTSLKSGNLSGRIFLTYLIYVYSLSAFVVVVNIFAFFLDSDKKQLGYGDVRRFVDYFHSAKFGYLTPCLVIISINIALYSVSFYKLTRLPAVQSNNAKRHELTVYVKLTIVTGVAWLLFSIDSVLNWLVLSFIVAFFNLLQGFVVFRAFIFNKSVLLLYQRLLRARESEFIPLKHQKTS